MRLPLNISDISMSALKLLVEYKNKAKSKQVFYVIRSGTK